MGPLEAEEITEVPPGIEGGSETDEVVRSEMGWSIEQKVTIAGIVLVVLTLMISTGADIVNKYIETIDGPEFGYRLDVGPTPYEDLGANRHPYSSGVNYPSFSSTVFIWGACISDSSPECGWVGSGVIISSKWVLTAAHVVEDMDPNDSGIVIGNDWEYGEVYFVESFHIHPNWNGEDELDRGFDIALVELSEYISGVYPSSWANDEGIDDSLIGETIFTSGFGDYSDYEGSFCEEACINDGDEFYSQKRAWANTLDRIIQTNSEQGGNDVIFQNGGHIVYDFDSPDGKNNSLSRGNIGYNFFQDYSYAGNGDSNSNPHALEGTGVPGDSGGPIYAKIGSKWTVIAVTSHGSERSNYGDVSFNTRVSVHADWICSVSSEHGFISGC